MPIVAIDADRVHREIHEISQYNDAPWPAVTRVLYTPPDMAVRDYLQGRADASGLAWREDALGNWFVTLPGWDAALPPVATGSHTDAIPYAGRFDGVVGVVGGLEALRAVKEAGITPRRGLELIMFTAEEPTRFGVGCLGSRALSGTFPLDDLEALTDVDGVTLGQARRQAGYADAIETVPLPSDAYSCFVELHIEQGSRLQETGNTIGIVTDIAAASAVRVTLTGDGGHAGTVMMSERRDACLAAAELALLVETTAKEYARSDAVGTVGTLELYPGASNSIPSAAALTIDLRARGMAHRDAMLATVHAGLTEIGAKRAVAFRWQVLQHDPSCASDPTILQTMTRCADQLGLPHVRLTSRAFHDTVFMGQKFPVAMLFIPSENGYSHRPEEFSTPEDIEAGVQLLTQTVLELADA